MMKYKYFVGIDVSKLTLDFALYFEGKQLVYKCVDNQTDKIAMLLAQLLQYTELDFSNTLFCLEHTGKYMNRLLWLLVEKKAHIWVESALQIKKSMGMVRGKSDKVDAYRIAEYAYRYCDKVKLWEAKSETLEKLAVLSSYRKTQMKALHQLQLPLQEGKDYQRESVNKLLDKCSKASICTLEQAIAKAEQEIEKLIAADENLKQQFELLTSIEGVGKVTAREVLIVTAGFTKFKSGKSLACYSGVAPFEHRSGTSVRGRNKVSHFANKKLKSLLHMCAMSAISKAGELQTYYLRKVGEGKNKMAVINAVRNKIIQRMFAVIRDNRKYEKNYQKQLV